MGWRREEMKEYVDQKAEDLGYIQMTLTDFLTEEMELETAKEEICRLMDKIDSERRK
jgi:hypothetical protein